MAGHAEGGRVDRGVTGTRGGANTTRHRRGSGTSAARGIGEGRGSNGYVLGVVVSRRASRRGNSGVVVLL